MTSSTHLTARTRAAFWVAACVIVQTLWTSAAPAMSYAWYARAWHTGSTTLAAIFAVYPLTVVLTAMTSRQLSARIGRRAAMLSGLAASIAGVFAFAVAGSVAALFVGRFLAGVGVGLAAGPASAALIDYTPGGDRTFASAINTSAQATGLAAAAISGGALIEYAYDPAHLTFELLLGLLIVLFVACSVVLPRDSKRKHTRHPVPSPARVAPLPKAQPASHASRGVVLRAAPAVVSAFIVGTVMLSLGAQIARDLVHSQNMLVNGAVIASFAIVWGVTSLLGKRMRAHVAVRTGGCAAAVSMVLLVFAAQTRSLPCLTLAVIGAGFGYSLLFLGGLAYVSEHADDAHKAASLSMMYCAGYAMQGATALALGMLASHIGLRAAVTYGAVVIAVLCVSTAVRAGILHHRAPADCTETASA
jgi:MFS family permease